MHPRHAAPALLLLALLAFAPTSARAYPPNFADSLVLGGLDRPVCILPVPDGRLLIAELDGRVLVYENGVLNPTPMLSLSVELHEEQGLLGMALDPDFPSQPYLYVLYDPASNPSTNSFHRISRFTVTGNSAGSEQTLFTGLPTGLGYHVAGCLRTSPGYLFATVGDNGLGANGMSPPAPRNLTVLRGKMIRLTLTGAIPPDNPFVGTAGARGEIYHRGLRNPFRFALDPVTGLPWINDVGQNSWEEINSGPPGSDFGWPTNQGTVTPPASGATNPKYTYAWTGDGTSITGAAFYTGATFPAEYLNNYFFLDHSKGWLGRVVLDGAGAVVSVNNTWGITSLSGWLEGPVDLAVHQGALYYTTYNPGSLRKVVYTSTVDVGAPSRPTLALSPSRPNPFQLKTRLPFSIDRAATVTLEVFDLQGRRRATLIDGRLDAGYHTAVWDAAQEPAGIYMARLESRGQVEWRRLVKID